MTDKQLLPIPDFYQPERVGEVWRVEYQQRAADARTWAEQHQIATAQADQFRVNFLLVDVQNTFCLPDFELFVAGRSGNAAVEDNQRLAAFIYQNLSRITEFTLTMDTHQAVQIFHAIYLIDKEGNHPGPYTLVSADDIRAGSWQFNPAAAETLEIDAGKAQRDLLHYVKSLEKSNRYELTIWPYHAMLGGIGHAVVPAIEEAVFFHSVARYAQPDFEIKGMNPFTEHYSVIGPEVRQDAKGERIAARNEAFVHKLEQFDLTIIAGQAKSHCVASTVSDLLEDIFRVDPELAKKVVLLVDCTSPVVVPGMDYTDIADAAFQRFADAGMKLMKTTDPVESWYPA
jgi:nicotinamidase-related amidase